MRGFILPAVVAAVLSASPFAYAAQTTDGIVKSFDAKTHVLTLEDGIAYNVPMTFNGSNLKAGEKVSVIWDMKDGKHVASSVQVKK